MVFTDEMKQKQITYNKNFYTKNIDKLKSKILCECGASYTLFNKSRHIRTNKKHLIFNTFIQPTALLSDTTYLKIPNTD